MIVDHGLTIGWKGKETFAWEVLQMLARTSFILEDLFQYVLVLHIHKCLCFNSILRFLWEDRRVLRIHFFEKTVNCIHSSLKITEPSAFVHQIHSVKVRDFNKYVENPNLYNAPNLRKK